MTRIYIFMLLFAIASGCIAQEKNIKFDFKRDGKRRIYYIGASRYDTLIFAKGSHPGDKELHIVYADSALVYLSTDFFDGSSLNIKNRFYSNQPRKRIGYLDTLLSNGVQANGLLWREDILGPIAVGYINVPANKKMEYDKIVASLKKKK